MIRRALISVSDKRDLLPFAAALVARGVEIISTGGTAQALRDGGLAVTAVADVTGYPELLGGRVKTLHPAIAAAVLAVGADHEAELARHGIQPIDLVAVTLYPFAEHARRTADLDELVEWIDVGGVTLLRAAAKNWRRVAVVSHPDQYAGVRDEFGRSGTLSDETRRGLAARAFALTSGYDAQIASCYAGAGADDLPETLALSYLRRGLLRYGENPHQRAALYVSPDPPPGEVVSADLLQGKALSYNNLVDLDAAWQAVREFDRPAAVVIKHATTCGAALGVTTAEATARAIAADTISAFGGIVAVNRPADADVVAALEDVFLEALIAPAVTPEAAQMLARRKNLRVLAAGPSASARPGGLVLRSLPGGLLAQDPDPPAAHGERQVVTRRQPTERERRDLEFAWPVCKHVRSNGIVFALDEQAVGIGGGQTSRVDSVRLAAMKAGERARGSVMASDAFFPFPDGIETAAAAGVTAVIQPGGSVRDAEVIAAADAADLAMVVTGRRHFRH